jgi:hypothetical protein
MPLNTQRLEEIRAESLSLLAAATADWKAHEIEILNKLPNFADNNVYQAQNFGEREYKRALERVLSNPITAVAGPTDLDQEYGARVVQVDGINVTRPFLDSAIEYQFLMRHLKGAMGVLDIGAGYGRLPRFLSSVNGDVVFPRVYAVDAIPVSTWLCEFYCGPSVETLTLKAFEEKHRDLDIGLVMNIHSWNECTYEQVGKWLEYILRTKAQYLFLVTANYYGIPYHSQSEGHKSFRPLLLPHFQHVAEEDISMHRDCPMTLWKRK